MEILGPNPEYRGMHPLKSLLKRFSEPTLCFWYVSTDDFDGLEQAIRDAGRCIERKMEVEAAAETGPAFVGASIGPGLWPVYSIIIQWKGDMKAHSLKDMPIVPIQTFLVVIGHQIETAKEFFESVGIDVACLHASHDKNSYLYITLETLDKRLVILKNEIESLGNWKVTKVLLKDLIGLFVVGCCWVTRTIK